MESSSGEITLLLERSPQRAWPGGDRDEREAAGRCVPAFKPQD